MEGTVRSHLRRLGARIRLGRSSLADHLTGGKVLRARLVLATAAVGDAPDWERARRYAQLVELVHAGALLHDDVVDRSTLRRGRPTLWSEVGAPAAVLAGAGLIVGACTELARDPDWLRRGVADALRDVARGQTDELGECFSTTVSPEACLRRARAKTGALYELAARLGAAAGGLDACTSDAVARFAAAAGLAFQLADDVRDLVGGPALGRPPGTDLRGGVYTLPILLTTAGRSAGGDHLRALLEQGALGPCVALLADNGALAETARQARALLDEAVASLAVLPGSPARDALEAWATDLLGRMPLDPVPAFVTWDEPADGRRRMDRAPVLPDLAIALHPTLPPLLVGLTRQLGAGGRRATAVAAGVSAVVLCRDVGDGEGDDVLAGARARRVGTVDLLLADFVALLAALPGASAAVVGGALADLLLAAASRAATATAGPALAGEPAFAAFVETVTGTVDDAACPP